MRFGEYIQSRMNAIGLDQRDMARNAGVSQAYISKIINGKNRPQETEMITKLAHALLLPDDKIQWLRVYSFLDCDPATIMSSASGILSNGVQESIGDYTAGNEHEIRIGEIMSNVVLRLGKPDEVLKAGPQTKWIYQKWDVHILFEQERVVKVVFK